MATLAELVQLAETTLSLEVQSEEFLDNLSRYSDTFAKWYGENKTRLDAPENFSAIEQEQLYSLSDKHTKLLVVAQSLLEGAGADLRQFRAHAKGLMVYADVLPKRVSFFKVRKG